MSRENRYHLLAACRRESVDFTPVWLMRQAGRYMKEYRALKAKYSFLEMCKTPELATQITLMPVDQVGVDGAIIFADILLPLEGMGIDLRFSEVGGPKIHNPVRSERDIEKLRIIDPDEDVPFLLEAIRQVRRELEGRLPLIGFSGAPFTLASYLIEGGYSKNFIRTKKLMYQNPRSWQMLMDKLVSVVVLYVRGQIGAGVQAFQLFDSWVGCLGPTDYETFVLPYSQRIFQELGDEVPSIHFATNSSTLLPLMRQAGGDVIGVDWRIHLGEAWEKIGYDAGIQGNLDPTVLFAPPQRIREAVRAILNAAENRPGHIFNLGHGVLPETPIDHVRLMVDAVHEMSQQ
ncbi:MAG: uroporphyrinogen decarboxylase [Proteobacteria bacterium]|nr:uroporphyrinogen decarboxylase [Pseudomonadota bacterium]